MFKDWSVGRRGSVRRGAVARIVLSVVLVSVTGACDRSDGAAPPTASSGEGIAYVVTNNCLTDVFVVALKSTDDDSAVGSPELLRDGATRTFETDDEAPTMFVVSWASPVSGGFDARFVPNSTAVELTGSWCPSVE